MKAQQHVKPKKTSLQDHYELAERKYNMARVIRRSNKPSDEALAAAKDLEDQATEHKHQAMLFGASFLMVLR